MPEKNLELERLVFFSDAVVAIAITLLALELKIEDVLHGHLTFEDLSGSWQKFIAFFLSFFIIALFWKIHHQFFHHIHKIDSKLLWYNMCWPLFIVLLPFTTSLISSYFFDTPAMSSYCFNVLFITIFQNQIWDYVAIRPEFLKEKVTRSVVDDYRLSCNIAMINALLAVVMSFLNTPVAFVILFLRLPMIYFARQIFKQK